MYHNVNCLHLRLPFDAEKMKAAIGWLLDRHPVLRTSFHIGEFDQPLQLVHRQVEMPLVIEDLRHLSPGEQERVLDTVVQQEKRDKFDWTRAPLVRFRVHLRDPETLQFTWSEHHAILDGWSLVTMVTELFEAYVALLQGTRPEAPPPPDMFREFVWSERNVSAQEEQRRFWAGQIADAMPSSLPRRPAAERQSRDETLMLRVEIPLSVAEGLHRLVQDVGAPLKSALLAAHLRVLALTAGSDEAMTGLVTNGRPEVSGGEKVLGLFLNTLPFRLKMPGGSWRELVRQTFEAEQNILPYRQFPLAEIQRLSGGILFETMFNFTNFHVLDRLLQLDGLQVLGRKSVVVDLNFALSAEFEIEPGSSQLGLRLDYNASELTTLQMRRIGDYYARILERMAEAPDSRYERFSPLSTVELQGLLSLGEGDRSAVASECLQGLFARQAALSADSIAVASLHETWTYRQLEEESNRLARYLLDRGVVAEQRVALFLDRTPQMIAAMLAVLKAGGAYVPLDRDYPAERSGFMLADSGAELVLTDQSLVALLPEAAQPRAICLDAERTFIERQSAAPPATPVDPRQLAYIIYTSGSTGRPKGVAIEHRSAALLLDWARNTFSQEDLRVVLASTSICFDLSIFEIFGPLSVGGSVALVANALALLDLPSGTGVTLINSVPSVLAEVARRGALPATARVVNLAGEPLPHALVEWLYEMGSVQRIHNLYGPSEDTTYSTWQWVEPGGAEAPGIGRPLSNRRVYLIDPYFQPTPEGVPGEVLLGGAGLARGYLGRADLTAERFLPDPWSGEAGARLYRTGDLARFRPNGETRVSRQDRPADQAAGLSHRVGRDRSCPVRASRGGRGGRGGTHRHQGGARSGGLLGAPQTRCLRGGSPQLPDSQAAEIYGACVLCRIRRPATDTQWQGRPSGAAGAGRAAASAGPILCRSPQRFRRRDRRPLVFDSRHRPGRGLRQLLRAWRPFSPRPPADFPHSGHVLCGAADAGFLPGSDGGGSLFGRRPRPGCRDRGRRDVENALRHPGRSRSG